MEEIMKVIIAGYGKVGAAIVRQLSSEGYDLTLIDSKQEVLDSTLDQYDIMTVTGNCATMNVLEEAGISDAKLLIAATSADEINLLCCLTAHTLNPHIHTIARIRNPEYSEQIFKMSGAFALSLVVNPEKQAAHQMERLLKLPGFLKRESFAKDRVEIVELRINGKSRLNGVALSNLDSIIKCKVLVCAVLRKGQAIMPDGNFVFQEDDRVFVTAPTNELAVLLKNLDIITHKVNHVMIAGGGRAGYYLASKLIRSGIHVQIIEKDRERCEELADLLPSADIICGDASNHSILESEGISNCDALVSMTGLDEINIIISLFANDIGVPQVITKIGHFENTEILDPLPIGSVICPKDLCCNTIVRYVRAIHNQSGAAVSVHSIANGLAEAVEFVADSNTRNCGIPLRNLHLKKGTLIVCITHNGKTEIPSGDSSFEAGDTVIIVTKADHVLLQLNDIFE
jgi:trk system potassium uptake protein TrkA